VATMEKLEKEFNKTSRHTESRNTFVEELDYEIR
jgi:hypothetical protein